MERLEIARAPNPNHLGYTIRIFVDNYDSRSHLWETQKSKEVMELVKKVFVCDENVMQNDNIITYGFLFQ